MNKVEAAVPGEMGLAEAETEDEEEGKEGGEEVLTPSASAAERRRGVPFESAVMAVCEKKKKSWAKMAEFLFRKEL